MSHTAAVLEFAAADHALPPQAGADAERLLADTLAGGAAGAASSEALELLPAVRGWGTEGQSRLLARLPELVEGLSFWTPQHPEQGRASTSSASRDLRLPATSAAFFNGFAIHCLEWDPVHEGAVVHALSVVTAALLAASDRIGGSDPDAFLTALAVGVDIASGLGLSATGAMKFFRPATAGVIGAAFAVARLEGLPRERFVDVMGLAYSFASGTMQAHIEASIALPLQIGNAARSAISAVDLAKAGMDGPHDVLEGPLGYSALIEPIDLSRYVPTLGEVWRISEVSIKPFPSGRASHGALGALQSLVGAEDVEGVMLHAPPLIHRLVGRPYKPGAAMSYNRLCFAFLAPLMLRDGRIDPRLTETDAELARRVEVVLDGNPDHNALGPQRLVVTMKNGTVIEREIPATLGSPKAPMSPAQANAKYDLCRKLAPDADPRIFDTPLAYTTEPR